MVHDLLFELGIEELPSAAVFSLAESLKKQMTSNLDRVAIAYGDVQFFATPRRLAVLILDVQEQQTDQEISRRGPAFDAGQDKNGNPTQALVGFAKSCGITVDALTTVETDKGKWWLYESVAKGVQTRDLLPDIINESLAALPIPKPMRWGDGDVEFARPVHWAILLLGDDLIDAKILGIMTGRHTYGHRFHHPEAVDIPSPRAYAEILKNAFVIADFSQRRCMIVEQLEKLAQNSGFSPVLPPELLDEVTSIVEWPVALMANFEREFLDVPAEALIASMQSHQKCFALRDSHGDLVPHFMTVSNIKSQYPEQVISGNEKVMRARLSDAAFFYRQDKRQPLSQYRAATELVLFQAKLGTISDKSNRLQVLLGGWVEVMDLQSGEAQRAAELSKCDLMTGMVGEFPELQGLMGYYYALHDQESRAVAIALNEQYMPRYAADVLPATSLGRALSLADRLDTLVGAFAIGQRPTGVKDPFKLRRHALAVIRLLIETPNAPALSILIQQSLLTYGDLLKPVAGAMDALRLFILDRLYAFYEGQGVTVDLVNAVRAREEDVLFDLDKRLQALGIFVGMNEAVSLSAACKRVTNILQQAGLTSESINVDPSLFQESAEKVLYERLLQTEEFVTPLYAAHDYRETLMHLAQLRECVDVFFDKVMVMVNDETQKRNRLALLARLQLLLQGVADISLLEISKN